MQNQSNQPATAGQRHLRWLYQQWQRFATFMVIADSPNRTGLANTPYQTKARFYPYLPASEENRDWLDKIYHQS